MPLVHLDDDYVAVDPLDDVRPEHEPEPVRDRVPALSPEQAKLLAALDEAEAMLTAAAAAHDGAAILQAQEMLEKIRDDALRAESRARDLRKAEAAARKAESETKKAEHRKKADAVAARLRKQAPEIRLPAPGGRTAVIQFYGDAFEIGYATEAARRAVWALTRALADQHVASRAAGRIVPLADWVSPLLTTEAGLLPGIERGCVRILEEEHPS